MADPEDVEARTEAAKAIPKPPDPFGPPLHVRIDKLRFGYGGYPVEGCTSWLVSFWRPTRRGIERKSAKWLAREKARRRRQSDGRGISTAT